MAWGSGESSCRFKGSTLHVAGHKPPNKSLAGPFHIAVRSSLVPGNTVLHKAVGNGHDSTLELLLRHKADIEAENKNGPGPQKEMRFRLGRFAGMKTA